MDKPTKICPLCNKEFVPTRSRQTFCLDKHIRVCKYCGKEFEVRRAKEAINQVTCSRQCSTKYRQQNGTWDAAREKLKQIAQSRTAEEKAQIQKKREATNKSKYGADNPFKSKEVQDKIKSYNLEHYGVEYISQSKEIKAKKKQTFQERYGVDAPLQSEEIREKWKQTNLEKYGTEYAILSEEVQDKIKQTNQQNLGVDYPFQSEDIRKRIDEVNLEKYGTKHPMQNDEVKDKLRQTIQDKYGYDYVLQVPELRAKFRQANLEKYGKEYYSQTEECKERIKQHMMQTYGVPYIFQTEEFYHKSAETRSQAINCDGQHMHSWYEVDVYNFCKAAGANIQGTQVPLKYEYKGETHTTFIDFMIDDMLFEVKGAHLLQGIYDYKMVVPIEQKLEVYKQNHVILFTDDTPHARELIGKPNSNISNGLHYLSKCPNPLIGVDMDLMRNNTPFPYSSDRPPCFYDVSVDGKPSSYEAFYNPELRWKMVKNRIMYSGGFIDAKQILTAFNVTRTCKQPSWFNKTFAKNLIQTYCTSNTIVDCFAGWGTRHDAAIELKRNYVGIDLNADNVSWHQDHNRDIQLGDATTFTYEGDCSVFICPPYQNIEIYFPGQDIGPTQCEWLKIVMRNVPNAKEYLMVCKIVDPGWERFVVDTKVNSSHFGKNNEYVLLVKQEDKDLATSL